MDTKRRSYDIYDIEERVHALELGGGDTPTPSGGSWDYSDTTPVDTHQKWIDGKTIMCKVITFTGVSLTGSTYMDLVTGTAVSSLNIDKVIDMKALINVADNYSTIYSTFINYNATENKIKILPIGGGTCNTLIIYYTEKTVTKNRSKKA